MIANKRTIGLLGATIVVAIVLVVAVACDRPTVVERTTTVGHDANSDHVPGMLRGEVHTADGKGVPGVLVAAASTDVPAKPVPELAIVTNGEGHYEWPLPPGNYRISVNASGFGTGSADVVITSGAEPEVDIVLR